MVRVIDGMKHRPRSTFGTVNAGVLQHFDDSFVRDDFVEIILNNSRIDPTPGKAEYRDPLARHDRCQQIGRHLEEKS
jgi:hypothetical protein